MMIGEDTVIRDDEREGNLGEASMERMNTSDGWKTIAIKPCQAILLGDLTTDLTYPRTGILVEGTTILITHQEKVVIITKRQCNY